VGAVLLLPRFRHGTTVRAVNPQSMEARREHTPVKTGGPREHTPVKTGGPGKHTPVKTGGPGEHTPVKTGGPGEHTPVKTGGPREHTPLTRDTERYLLKPYCGGPRELTLTKYHYSVFAFATGLNIPLGGGFHLRESTPRSGVARNYRRAISLTG